MSPVGLLLGAILVPCASGLLTLALPRRAMGLRVLLATAGPVAALALLALYIAGHGVDAPPVSLAWMPDLQLNVDLHADRLGLFFALLVAGIGLLITLYARAYFGPSKADLYRFFPSLHLFMTAMLGVALADNFVLLLIFWELTSISSFLLIGWEREDSVAVKNAMQAFVITGTGGLALMGGLILLGAGTGVWTFSELFALDAGQLSSAPYLTAAFVLMFVGAAAKSAQWPLHFWLPGAMAAPTPVSAYLHSATMVKAGVYLVGRLAPILAGVVAWWPTLILPIGTATMLLGSYVALRKSDLKQIFAYTTVSQLGLLMCMYGLSAWDYKGETNLIWDVTQILNHALYKAPLFIVAGAVAHIVHTRQLPALQGLARCGGQKAIMAWLLILAAYALAAWPFTLSFTAKEMFFAQVWHAWEVVEHWALAGLVVAGVLTAAFNAAIFLRLARVLLGRPQHTHGHIAPSESDPADYVAHPTTPVDESPSEEDIDVDPHERGFWPAMLWIPAAVILLWQYVGGIAPGAYEAVFGSLERSRNYLDALPSTLHAITHPGPPLYMTLIGSVLGAGIAFAPLWRSVIRDVHDAIYPAFYSLVVSGGARVFRIFQGGHLRTYMGVSLVMLLGLFAWIVLKGDLLNHASLPRAQVLLLDEPGLLPAYAVCGTMMLAAITLAIITGRATRILVLGVAGTSITLLFYLYQAPDLALTQISIEVVSLILFLLVLALVPDQPAPPVNRKPLRLALAAAVGLMMGWLTLSASTADTPPRIVDNIEGAPVAHLGEYFLRNSKHGTDTLAVPPEDVFGGVVDRGEEHAHSFGTHAPLPQTPPADAAYLHKGGGGANVVNVILVDFRGFDTMGEITVLALAALGVWTLLRQHRGEQPYLLPGAATAGAVPFIDARISTPILKQAVKVLVPLAVLFSFFVFFKGHQTPGGGFVGGLIASVALIIYRMTFGTEALYRLMPIRERTCIALGLALAATTGGLALLAGLPFFTSNHGYIPIPGSEPFEWTTVMFFDAGVYLVVVGVTVGMIDALSREVER
jgi:NADH:ubiquinone oxidoreductase subunit 5 (subunit L)/multisubunit Na+/H+ antiporter MnhA subunit/multisubunit Na+/H+ antiporter MnhB subunit